MSHIIRLERFSYTAQTTIGKLYINDEYFGYTLEDTVRCDGVKVKKETAIPGGSSEEPQIYKTELRESGRFGTVPVVYTHKFKKPGYYEYVLRAKGIEFSYILFHGGNTHINTEGCILVAKNFIDKDKIQGSLKKELSANLAVLLKDCDVKLEVVNLPQSN